MPPVALRYPEKLRADGFEFGECWLTIGSVECPQQSPRQGFGVVVVDERVNPAKVANALRESVRSRFKDVYVVGLENAQHDGLPSSNGMLNRGTRRPLIMDD